MERTSEPRKHKPTAIVMAVLVLVIVGALFELSRLGSSDQPRKRARTRPAVATTAPPLQATSATTGPPIAYQVARGDNLTAIARRFGVTTEAIVAANQIDDPDHLTEGQTLLIPPAPPVQLVVTPAKISAGGSVELQLSGAKPSENVTFEIDSPNGAFTGPPHRASSEGIVTASYEPALDAPPGTYTVIAQGDQGTTAQAGFRVRPASP